VAYAPAAVTIFEGIRRYFARHDFAVDYVLYSNYDALVGALERGEVEIAWNTPLAHAQYHCRNQGASQTLVTRDVDCDFRCVLIARADSGIDSVAKLPTAKLVLGSNQAAEATVLPLHFLEQEGLDVSQLDIVSLDGAADLQGNPCSSERHVLQALREGRGQAGVIGQRLWQQIAAEQSQGSEEFVAVWTSPPFSHCVFTASDKFDQALAHRFTELMLAMDPGDPLTAEVMRLEGTRKWVAGSPDGFRELITAIGER
jgi:ABC-type phosphate/phosphonate transport system substrate-binding protein